jgi:hypothetical protein
MYNTIIIEATKGNKKCLLKYNENDTRIYIQTDKKIFLDSFELAKEFESLPIDLEAKGWIYKLDISTDEPKSTAEENNQYENLEDLLDSIDIDFITKGFLDTAVKYACISGDMQTTII